MVGKGPKMSNLSPKMSNLCPKMSTFVHYIRKAHKGFKPLILLAKIMVRRESGQEEAGRHVVHNS
jgi:hypothetical protein